MVEFELKLAVPATRKTEILEALALARTSAMSQTAHYFDTEDGRLAACGLSLRLRREGRRWVQTLKAEGDSPVRRLEDSVVVPTPRAGRPSIELERHRSAAAREVLEKVLKHQASKAWPPLVERFLVKVSRRTRDVEADGEKLEVAFDAGHIEAQGRKLPVCELEIELKSDGHPVHMFALARQLVHEHHLWLSTESKSARGEALLSAQGHERS